MKKPLRSNHQSQINSEIVFIVLLSKNIHRKAIQRHEPMCHKNILEIFIWGHRWSCLSLFTTNDSLDILTYFFQIGINETQIKNFKVLIEHDGPSERWPHTLHKTRAT